LEKIMNGRDAQGDPDMQRRLARYLASRRNLAGCALALLAVGLTLVDPVGPAGLLLVAGFYGLGAAAMPSNRVVSRFGFDPKQVEKAMRQEISEMSGRVPPDVILRVQRIELIIRAEILPRLDGLPPGSLDLYLVERTARGYLPTAVDRYLRLAIAAASQPYGSEAARAALIDQLNLLEAEMRRIADALQRTDMDRMLAQRRFLSERFGRLDPSG
jgi:hypothetical protein